VVGEIPNIAKGTPKAGGTFKGLAQAPLHLHNLVAELIDNSINAKPQGFNVVVDISQHQDGGDHYIVTVKDDGPGISLNDLQNKVFVLGHEPDSNASHLSEHGFGLKNVLSKAERISNYPWTLITRDRDASQHNTYYEVERPLADTIVIQDKPASAWPFLDLPDTGTALVLELPLSYLQTVAYGRRGAYPRNLGPMMEYLREHLGVFYRGYLEGGKRAIGQISTSLNGSTPEFVDPIEPDYKSKDPYTISVNYNGKKFDVEGVLGIIEKNSSKTKKRLYYYRFAPDSQGVDFRVGNRIIETRMISEIWERERHPSLNGIAGEFKISSSDKSLVPPTLNNKTSIDHDSKIWQTIAEQIRLTISGDDLPHGGGKSEDDLCNELFGQIEGLKHATEAVHKEYDCGHGVYVDVVWDKTSHSNMFEIYEAKKGKGCPLDVYQLVMYWDCLVDIGVRPTTGHLVCETPSPNVTHFVTIMNNRKDKNGNNYDFVVETWQSHKITTSP